MRAMVTGERMMPNFSRRKLMTAGIAAAGSAAGLAVAARLGPRRYGLIPPDGGGIYGPAKLSPTPRNDC